LHSTRASSASKIWVRVHLAFVLANMSRSSMGSVKHIMLWSSSFTIWCVPFSCGHVFLSKFLKVWEFGFLVEVVHTVCNGA
jgi:hypothetical protein